MTLLQPVKSSMLHSVGYDPSKAEAHVRFSPTGPTYIYSGVSPADYAAWMQSPSLGKHFAANIKGKLPHRKL